MRCFFVAGVTRDHPFIIERVQVAFRPAVPGHRPLPHRRRGIL